jgi:hypothetical protein
MMPPRNDYICRVPIAVQEQERPAYVANKLMVLFSGQVFILDAEKKEIAQQFDQLAQIGPGKILPYRPYGAIPAVYGDSDTAYRVAAYLSRGADPEDDPGDEDD